MKIKHIGCLATFLFVSLVAQAQTTITAWTFDNLSIGNNSSPLPSSGFGAASAVDVYNGSVNFPDVQSLAGSSSGGANSWRVRGNPGGGNEGWSINAPIGTQGAKFTGSTAGYYKIKVSFDGYATVDAEARLQVQYTTEGTIWKNAGSLTSGGTAVVQSNSNPTNKIVVGSYVSLASGWNNNITVDLTGVSGIDNNPNFAVRIVNAATGTNCLTTTGALYNNTSGNWTFDNVAIKGVSFDTITGWTFESNGTVGFVPHPVPEFGSGLATSLGFDTSYVFSDGAVGSTNKPDTLANGAPFSSTGASGQTVWRVRGQGPGNGWNTQSPIGSQGAEFDVSTVNYDDILISFDMFSTSQGEAKMCVLYSTDNWATTNIASTLFYASNPTFMLTNAPTDLDYSADTVAGTYFYQTVGQNFFNNFIVDLSGVSAAANNTNFAFRIVNAAQNGDCVAFNGGSYNNSSGNWRYDNVTVSGTFVGSLSPVIAYDPTATVDGPFTNTFTDDPLWRSNISAVYVNGSVLTNSAYTTNAAGKIIFTPSKSTLLQSSGVKSIVIFANGYNNDKVTQPLLAGVATKLTFQTQPKAPSASGGTLTVNPILAITDQFGNGSTNPYANVTVTASVGGVGAWTLGGSTIQTANNGFVVFSNLTATVNGSTAVSGAFITFNLTGYTPITVTNSATFNIGAPPVPFTPGNLAVLQIDTVSNNTTFSMIEVKPSVATQTSPLNIVPIKATGTNALRLSSTGSCGRLTLSDDGTLLAFAAFVDDSSATPDETLNLNRAVGTLNYTNLFSAPASYTSISLGGSQARSAATVNNTNYIIVDKGGLYMDSVAFNLNNNIVVKTFGGTPYVQTQKTAAGSPIPAVYGLTMSGDGSTITGTLGNNLATDPVAVDFHMVSSDGGVTFDVLYILDQISGTLGVIKKYSLVAGDWAASGSFTNSNGADSLFAATNGNGGVYLYYTTGGGGTAANQIVRLTDSAGWNTPISIISSNVIYTATSGTSIKGLTFVPQQAANAVELTPPPILIAQAGATVGGQFSVTNSPEIPAWRAAITGITINGFLLPPAAYNSSQAGKIVFDPSQSVLLQTNGAKTIVISATGYSAASVTQSLGAGAATKLALTTQPTAPLADGGALAAQPVVVLQDAYGNTTTSTATVTAAPVQITWTLGGTKTKAAVSGTAAFTGLTAFSTNAVTGATILFTSPGVTSVTSSPFNIPAPNPSTLGGVSLAGGKLTFAFSNAAGLSYSVLSTNDVSAPIATWPVIGAPVEGPAGIYRFTNSIPATNPQQFYILRQP